jgi:hypothetical protein
LSLEDEAAGQICALTPPVIRTTAKNETAEDAALTPSDDVQRCFQIAST